MSRNHIPYFSLYPSDFMNGVRGMSAQEVGTYMMLLCRIYEESAPVEYNVLRLSTYCGMRAATFEKVVEKLVDLGKLTFVDGALSNRRAEIEISKRANDLKNSSRAGKASAEKRQQNQRNIATGVQHPFNHTDTDTDTDKDIPVSSDTVDLAICADPPSSQLCVSPASKRRRAEVPIPPDWVPSDRNLADAKDRNFSASEIDHEARQFRDYHLSKDNRYRDWDAAWRTWLGNAARRGKASPRHAGAGAGHSALFAGFQRAAGG